MLLSELTRRKYRTGRFILLKLWSPGSNTEIQTVTAHGYGGPRFFPALEVR
jgi:hypothetical protein